MIQRERDGATESDITFCHWTRFSAPTSAPVSTPTAPTAPTAPTSPTTVMIAALVIAVAISSSSVANDSLEVIRIAPPRLVRGEKVPVTIAPR